MSERTRHDLAALRDGPWISAPLKRGLAIVESYVETRRGLAAEERRALAKDTEVSDGE